MGVVADLVGLADVADAIDLRFDPHHYRLRRIAQPHMQRIRRRVMLSADLQETIRIQNGVNLPQRAYALPDDDVDARYVSVSAVSQFALQREKAVALRFPDPAERRLALARQLESGSVVITRSGTPGIAWAVSEIDDEPLIPSGFMIQVDLGDSDLAPEYVAMMLNHPLWRIWTASLSAGKRQRNLSQAHLGVVGIPAAPEHVQLEIGRLYREMLDRIDKTLQEPDSVMPLCDDTLRASTGIDFTSLVESSKTLNDVSLRDVGESSQLRMDCRWHRPDFAAVLAELDRLPTVPVRSLLKDGAVLKGTQPGRGDPDASDEFVITTASIQAGQIVEDQLRPAPAGFIGGNADRVVARGDVVLTMDGAVSIGRAASFDGEYSAVPDSHVAILRLDPATSDAICCFLNSSLGQAQIKRAISGALAPQLSVADLAGVEVPTPVISQAAQLGRAFKEALRAFETRQTRVRREVCSAAAEASALLVSEGLCEPEFEELASVDRLLQLWSVLTPDMF